MLITSRTTDPISHSTDATQTEPGDTEANGLEAVALEPVVTESDGVERVAAGDAGTEAVDHMARGFVFPDKVKIRPSEPIATDILTGFRAYKVDIDGDGVVVREHAYDQNLYVGNNYGGDSGPRSLISGSLRNWADAVDLIGTDQPFGSIEVGVVLNALAVRYGLSNAAVRSAWLSFVEVACDLNVPRSVAEYARSFGDMSRATTHRSGDTTVRYETSKWGLTAYEKGSHLLRIEVRVKSPATVFGSRLRADDLADSAFRDDLIRLWVDKARSIPVARSLRDDRRGLTASQLVRRYALQAMADDGGLDAVIAEVRADRDSGIISTPQMNSRIRDLRALGRDTDLTVEADLSAELTAAIDEVEAGLPDAVPNAVIA